MRWIYLAILGLLISVGLIIWGIVWLVKNNNDNAAWLITLGVAGLVMTCFCSATLVLICRVEKENN